MIARTLALHPASLATHACHEERRVTWGELFYDLVFVAAVAQVGTALARDYSAAGLGRYAFMLAVIWWAWNGYAMYATRFAAEDRLQKALAGLQMVAVIFMAANAEGALDSISTAGFLAAYAVMRLVLALQYVRALSIPAARPLAFESALGIGVAALVWLTSALAPASWRYVLWAVASSVDVGTAVRTSRFVRLLPPNAHHLPERFGLFTLILLGESIIALMKGIQSQPEWSLAAASAAFLGIGLIFGLWWWYFDGAAAASHRPLRSDADFRKLTIWNYAHLPVYLGLAVTAVGIEHIVRAGGREPLHAAEAWILCGAASMVTSALVALSSVSSKPRDQRLPLSLTLAAAPLLLAVLAPVAPPSLIVATLTALTAVQVAILPKQLEDDDATGSGDVERRLSPEHRDPDRDVARGDDARRQPLDLVPEDDAHRESGTPVEEIHCVR
jgi:low temperature requirement protein LtrA